MDSIHAKDPFHREVKTEIPITTNAGADSPQKTLSFEVCQVELFGIVTVRLAGRESFC